jgi:hypothetical protein
MSCLKKWGYKNEDLKICHCIICKENIFIPTKYPRYTLDNDPPFISIEELEEQFQAYNYYQILFNYNFIL